MILAEYLIKKIEYDCFTKFLKVENSSLLVIRKMLFNCLMELNATENLKINFLDIDLEFKIGEKEFDGEFLIIPKNQYTIEILKKEAGNYILVKDFIKTFDKTNHKYRFISNKKL